MSPAHGPGAPPPPLARPSLTRLATRGALWTGLAQGLLFALGVVKTIILARLVPREYFGLLAGATVWTSYLSLGRLDLRLAVLKSQEEPEVLATQFLIENASALLGFTLAGALAVAWPGLLPPAVWGLVVVLLAAAQIEALTSTSVYVAQHRLRQDLLGRLATLSALVGFIVPMFLALIGTALPALVLNALLPWLLPRVCAVFLIRWRPRFAWHLAEMRAQLRLAWVMWSTGLLGKIAWDLDDWLVFNLHRPGPVIWRSTGVVAEALYARAFSIGKMPMDVAASSIGTSALALYTESVARGPETLARAHRQLTWLLAWIVFSSGTLLFISADDLARVLGPDWGPIAPLLRLMAAFVIGRPLLQNGAQLLLAMREERAFRRVMGVQAAVMLVACPPAVYWFGAAGAALVASVTSVVAVVAVERRVARCLGHSGWPLYVRPGAAALAAGATVALLASVLPNDVWLAALIRASIPVLCFAAVLWTFDRPAARETWRNVRQGLARA